MIDLSFTARSGARIELGIWVLSLALLVASGVSVTASEIRVSDGIGREVALAATASRVVSLAPHVTEMLFALGAGEHVVATVRFADYPPAARAVPRIGDAFSVSLEALLATEPELVLAWAYGSPAWLVPRLRDLGVPLYLSGPRRLEDIGPELVAMGTLVGKSESARRLAAELARELETLGHETGGRRTFFQVSWKPIYTVSSENIIGAALSRCATNVFADLAQSSPQVSLEAVLVKRPERIVVTVDEAHPETQWREFWRAWGWEDRLVFVPADLLSRPGPRMVEGVKIMCRGLAL